MSKLVKKHDQLARKFLIDLTVAREFLEIYLPLEIRNRCDLSTISIESGAYIENDLQSHYSDVVYKVNFKEIKECAYIYTLVEHLGIDDKLMPFRILRYQIAIIQNHLDKYAEELGYKLPLVVPLVLYNGKKSPYPYATDIKELFAHYDLYPYAELGKFKLLDLMVTEDDEILQHKKLVLLEMLLKHIRVKDFASKYDTIMKAFKIADTECLNLNLVAGAISYLVSARETKDIKELILSLQEEIPNYEETIMIYAEELKMEGRRAGLQEGRQEGRQEGQQAGIQHERQEIAKKLLKSGADNSFIAKITDLTLIQIEKLKKSLS